MARKSVTENPDPIEVDAPGAVSAETNMGAQVEVGFDPKTEQVRKAAMAEWTARQNPGEWVGLGNGAFARVQPSIAPSYDVDDEDRKEAHMLGRLPEMILDQYRKPNFVAADGSMLGYRYRWMVFKSINPTDNRPEETKNLHRGGRIRYVETAEMNDACPFAVYTEHPAGDRTYVTHMSLILCEVLDPRLAWMNFKAMEERAMGKLKTAKQDVPNSPSLGAGLITAVPGKAGMKYDQFNDARRAGS